MKSTHLVEAVEKVVALKMKAVDEVIREMIEPLSEVGNPEALINKPYAQWSPQDLTMLAGIYGSGDHTALANTIFRNEYNKLKAMEQEEQV